jgi:septation ring formation regulator EzrA
MDAYFFWLILICLVFIGYKIAQIENGISQIGVMGEINHSTSAIRETLELIEHHLEHINDRLSDMNALIEDLNKEETD